MAEKKANPASAAAAVTPREVAPVNLQVVTRRESRERRFSDVVTINHEGIAHVNTKLTRAVRAAYGSTLQRYNLGRDQPTGTLYLIFTGMEDEDAYRVNVGKSGNTFTATVNDVLPKFNVVIPKGRIGEAPAEVVNVVGKGICLALKLTDLPMKVAPKRTPREKKGKNSAQEQQEKQEKQEKQAKDQAAATEQKSAGGSEEKAKS